MKDPGWKMDNKFNHKACLGFIIKASEPKLHLFVPVFRTRLSNRNSKKF